jgi:transcriptional regulator with XRE-family HTH domain
VNRAFTPAGQATAQALGKRGFPIMDGLGQFLRNARTAIPPEARCLGRMLRHPNRIAKPVTQEEVAEVLGISREWYARIECGRQTRVPPALLGQLADVLMLQDPARNELFACAIPELRAAPLGETAAAAFERIALQPTLKRLWAASSEAEILRIVLEYGQTLFLGTDIVLSTQKLGQGLWQLPVVLGTDAAQRRVAELAEMIADQCSPFEADQWFLHGVLVQPGETVLFNKMWTDLTIVEEIPDFLRRAGLGRCSVLVSHVRSRKDFVGNLAIGSAGASYHFSETEVTIFGALADLASLALST